MSPRRQETLASAFEGLRQDYAAAKRSRFRRVRSGVPTMGAGADYHYRTEGDYLRMMEYARDMDRNDVVVGQTVDRAVVNAIQDGITLDAQTGDSRLDQDLMARWRAWATDPDQCDVAGEQVFADFETLALRSTFIDGDILCLGTKAGPLEAIEAHRVRKPTWSKVDNIVHGIEKDSRGRALQYWITRSAAADWNRPLKVEQFRKVPARDKHGNRQVFHVMIPKRLSQSRGVTAFAPVFDTLGMIEDINFARLVQQQIVSCFAVFREMEFSAPGGPAEAKGAQETETLSDGRTRTIESISPGMDITGRPGETLTGFSPNVPNPEYFPFMKMVLTFVGINMGMPLVLVLLDASETNFSGWRGAVDQARLGFRRNQRWMIERFHRPVYRWKVRQWMSEDPALRIAAENPRTDIFGHRWNPPTWPYIEPYKDARADELRLKSGLTSPRRLHAERGRAWEEVSCEIVEDRAILVRQAIETATEINRLNPNANVDWRELAGFEGVGCSSTQAQPAETPQEEGEA